MVPGLGFAVHGDCEGAAWRSVTDPADRYGGWNCGTAMVTRFSGLESPTCAAREIQMAFEKMGFQLRRRQGFSLISAGDYASAAQACLRAFRAMDRSWSKRSPGHIFGNVEDGVTESVLAQMKAKWKSVEGKELSVEEQQQFMLQLLQPLLLEGGLKGEVPCSFHSTNCHVRESCGRAALKVRIAGSPCVDWSR